MRLPSRVPSASCRRSQRDMSRAVELTPPAGAWASGSRTWAALQVPSGFLTCVKARSGRSANAENSVLVEVIPAGLKRVSSASFCQLVPSARATASAAAVRPKFV